MVFKSDKHTMAGYSNGSQSPERLNRIVEGTHIEGEIKSDSNIRIDGYVKGIINVKGRLVLGPTGKIDGNIFERRETSGQFTGKRGTLSTIGNHDYCTNGEKTSLRLIGC